MPSPDIIRSHVPDDEEKTAFITPQRPLLLQSHAIRTQKRWRHLSETDDKDLQTSDRPHVEYILMISWLKAKPERSMFFIYKSFSPFEEVWHEAESFQMRLWRKCWQILGFMVSQRGIEVSRIKSRQSWKHLPQEQEGITGLTGKLVALGRFIARFTDELRPFFLAIRKAGANGWTDTPFYSAAPHPRSRNQSTTSAEHWRRRNQVFKNGANSLSPSSAAQKLRPYFQAHPVVVLTDQPLRNILHKPDLTGRMLQWAIELSEFGIEFQPRLSMKGQVMADFVLEYSRRPNQPRNQVKKNGGLCELMEPHDHQGPESGFCYSPQQGNTWSKPSGWDSLPPTMKQNMRPSYPDWTSLWLYPSPNSGSIAIRNS
ncbi:hypothetical protein CK203_100620 [Vitis vinifera]|uniref:Reverse transcriptase RNase H-like domain-containing protein n=1 Tax=Vitis vinifera TaxID=29760 RepID=A0A438FIG4_VITVI|nr:hypothetical protein CK203_100620 [Vitis vinifera]